MSNRSLMPSVPSKHQNSTPQSVVHGIPAAGLPTPHPEVGSSPQSYGSEAREYRSVNISSSQGVEVSYPPEELSGFFLGMRSALLFNAVLGLVGLLAFEAWSMLAK